MNKLELVKEWRRTFGLPVSETPVVPSVEQLLLHDNMIEREAEEISQAKTHIDIRDVIADLHYFILGLASEAGVTKEQLDSDFEKVHAANMAKLWTEDEVESRFIDAKIVIDHASRIDFVTPEGTWTATPSSNVDNGLWIVRLNGKVQKPPGWKAAVLEGGAV